MWPAPAAFEPCWCVSPRKVHNVARRIFRRLFFAEHELGLLHTSVGFERGRRWPYMEVLASKWLQLSLISIHTDFVVSREAPECCLTLPDEFSVGFSSWSRDYTFSYVLSQHIIRMLGNSKSRNKEMRNEKWEMRKWGNEEMGKWEANCWHFASAVIKGKSMSMCSVSVSGRDG